MSVIPGKIRFCITLVVISVGLFSFTVRANMALSTAQQDETPYYKCWQYSLDSALAFAPVTDNGTVFLPETGGILKALDSGTGSVKWSVELGGVISSNVILANSDIYLVSSPVRAAGPSAPVSYLRLINSQSGIIKKNTEIPYGDVFDIAVEGNNLLVVNRSGMAAAFDLSIGERTWQKDLTSEVKAPPGISAQFVALALKDDSISVLDVKQGSVVFEMRSAVPLTSIEMLSTGRLVIGDNRGNVTSYMVAERDNSWKFKVGGAVASISAAGDDILLTSLDNFLYFIDPMDGSVRWRKRLAGRATFAPLWLKNRVFIPTFGESSIMVTEIFKGKTVNKIELGENMYPLQVPRITGSGQLVFSIPGSIAAFGPQSCVK